MLWSHASNGGWCVRGFLDLSSDCWSSYHSHSGHQPADWSANWRSLHQSSGWLHFHASIQVHHHGRRGSAIEWSDQSHRWQCHAHERSSVLHRGLSHLLGFVWNNDVAERTGQSQSPSPKFLLDWDFFDFYLCSSFQISIPSSPSCWSHIYGRQTSPADLCCSMRRSWIEDMAWSAASRSIGCFFCSLLAISSKLVDLLCSYYEVFAWQIRDIHQEMLASAWILRHSIIISSILCHLKTLEVCFLRTFLPYIQ